MVAVEEKDIDTRLTRVEERTKSNTHRLDEAERRLSDNERMIQSVSLIAQRQEALESDVREIKTDVKSLAAKPAKRWDMIVQIVLSALVGGLITYILVQLGLRV